MTFGLNIGLQVKSINDPNRLQEIITASGYKYSICPIISHNPSLVVSNRQTQTLPLDDLILNDAEKARQTLCLISEWIELDSIDEFKRIQSEIILKQQCEWVAHCGVKSVLFDIPESVRIVNFSKMLNDCFKYLGSTNVILRLPLGNQTNDSWERWNFIRSMCPDSYKITLSIFINEKELPSPEYLARWKSEPIRHLNFSESAFLLNSKQFPVLSKDMKQFIWEMMRRDVNFVMTVESDKNIKFTGGLSSFQEYFNHLYKSRPALDAIDNFAYGYHDVLQTPLQPLMHNLESATYEVFEMDPIKYAEYERAIYLALMDMTETKDITITVVGAGRGPLVDRALQAAKSANRAVTVFALEKNPNAIITLKNRKETVWGDAVTLIHSDMRYWNPEKKSNIIISELLGSFGDNELSPECLDGIEKFLEIGGVMIPSSYTAFIAPVSTEKLHNDALAYKKLKNMETPYVVLFRQSYDVADAKALWTFNHPNLAKQEGKESVHFNSHNKRHASVEFNPAQNALVHGFSGYFEAVLYKDVNLSIVPKTHSPGMLSWFSMYFPIRMPVFVTKDSKLEANFWRCTDARKVWYEWNLIQTMGNTTFMGGSSVIHNPGGRSSWIGL